MTDQHPATPTPQKIDEFFMLPLSEEERLVAAFCAGADQELEACCEWVTMETPASELHLRSARRPKPPSVKEQLLQKLEHIRNVADKYRSTQNAIDGLREALEALPND